MLTRLLRKSPYHGSPPPPPGRLPVLARPVLLEPHKALIGAIRSIVGVPEAHWDLLYEAPLGAFAQFVQQLPASEVHHHAGPGGLLRHALEVAHEAMKLRRGALLPPGASAEELARLQDVWSYACVTAALLHDIGKPLADQRITLFDANHAPLGHWSPVDGTMPPAAHSYRVEFVPKRRYRRHERLAPLLAPYIMPSVGIRWLAGEPEAMDAWLAALQGDYEEAGPLGAIIAKADGLSVARDLSGGGKVQLPTARSRPLADRLLTGLRYLLAQDELPLNRRGAAGFLAGEDLWLVSKRVLDALREHLAREGQIGIPSRNDRLMDELQQHGLLIPNDDRAIWTCEVRIDDWAQRLTFLRLEVSAVWSDPERRPPAFDGTVVPVAEPSPGEAAEVSEAPGTERLLDAPGGTEPLEPGETAEQYDLDGLPLPFDIEAPATALADVKQPGPASRAHHRRSRADAGPEQGQGTDEDVGHQFVAWLKENIASGRVEINTVNARLHVLPEGLALVSPGIFRDFDAGRWDKAQKRFQKMKLHQKTPEGTNIWSCRVAKERKQSLVKVMLVPEPEKKLGVKLPPPNPVVRLLTGAARREAGPEEQGDGQAV